MTSDSPRELFAPIPIPPSKGSNGAVMPPQVPRCEELSSSRISEGEGSIHRNNGRYWQATLASTDKSVVVQFADIIGVGKLYGPHWAKKSTKPYWKWVVSDKRGLEVVWDLIGPFLHARRRAMFEQMVAELDGRRSNGTWRKQKSDVVA